VFGSVAQGKERGSSDVDLMVLGSVRFERLVEALMPVGERLRREINPVVMTPQEFRTQLKARDRFVSRVAREPKLFIQGDAGEFGEPAPDRATEGASR
jgi:predicted nucleotidyltransferase